MHPAGVLPERTDVVIVGAGPTGLSLACALLARGVAVVVLDRAAAGGNTSRAAVVHARVRARYGVGCDGMHSVVREQAGIGFAGASYAQSFVLADVDLAWPLSRDEVQLFFSPGGLVVVAPLPGDRHRVVATLDDAPEHPGVDDVQALLDARGPAADPGKVLQLHWSSRFSVHRRLADAYRRGPVFLAGDAAHVHSPAGGQGMNTGIQDAMVLAGMLADVLAGRAGDAHLDGYQAIRRPVAVGVVSTTDRITRLATARNPLARAVRNTALGLVGRIGPVRRRLAMDLSELATDPARRHASPGWRRRRGIEPP